MRSVASTETMEDSLSLSNDGYGCSNKNDPNDNLSDVTDTNTTKIDDKRERTPPADSVSFPSPLYSSFNRLSAPYSDSSDCLLDVESTDSLFVKASLFAIAAYIVALSLAYYIFSADTEYLTERESNSAWLAFLILLGTLGVVCVQTRRSLTGIIFASYTVYIVALITNAALAYLPSIVLVDKYSGARVFLVRWCEWVPLAGLMTFLSEAVDLPRNNNHHYHVASSLLQTVSCIFGMLLPIASQYSMFAWFVCLVTSFVTYLGIFPRVAIKYRNYKKAERGYTFAEQEAYERLRFAYHLILTCSLVWTVLVVFYFTNIAFIYFLPDDHALKHPSLAMILDTTFDVIAKAIYMSLIVDVHFQVYEPEGRAKRQLNELRTLMSVLWDGVSDVLIISVGQSQKITTALSPSFRLLFGDDDVPQEIRESKSAALMIETSWTGKLISASFVDSALSVSDGQKDLPKLSDVSVESRLVKNVCQAIDLVWENGISVRREKKQDEEEHKVEHTIAISKTQNVLCEVKVSTIPKCRSVVAAIRDVTERQRRFEAEKRAHEETLARQRDAQSINRFTRHEVKNGLLAGIELCESLRKASEDITKHMDTGNTNTTMPLLPSLESLSHKNSIRVEAFRDEMAKFLKELDSQLHGTLDTVLAEAMARDVIHGVFVPRLEKCNIEDLVAKSVLGMGSQSFPIKLRPANIPPLKLDPQLVLYIHRNAISNACKYGTPGGEVKTVVDFDESNKMLTLSVINEPGEGHQDLVMMGEEANEAVFLQGKRLHSHLGRDIKASAGDGAWIMQKCALTMSGTCKIQFHPDRTIFTLTSPVEVYEQILQSEEEFSLPEDTWGVAVDDSKIQRKLMSKILINAGIEKSRVLVLGGSPEEVYGFEDQLKELLRNHPKSKFLILMDENLDFPGKIVLSGSQIIHELLVSLTPQAQSRVLALVRSANDSASDIAQYKKLTHGFFPKAPILKDGIREILEPLWIGRFGATSDDEETEDDCSQSLATAEFSVSDEFLASVYSIDDLVSTGSDNWVEIWNKLHNLRGDFKALGILQAGIDMIENMEGPEQPTEFRSQWEKLRNLVVSGMETRPNLMEDI